MELQRNCIGLANRMWSGCGQAIAELLSRVTTSFNQAIGVQPHLS
jgi:hypothetical protein